MDEIIKIREQYVAKSNTLIQKSRYSLTLQQQRILLYLISKIKPDDTPEETYTFSIDEFCKVCGITASTGDYYKTIKDDLLYIRNNGFWLKREDGSLATASWLSKAYIIPLCGEITVKFDEDTMPYLFQLRTLYTQYKLKSVLAFKGKYTIRLYEIIRSYYTQRDIDYLKDKEISFTPKEIREILLLKPIYPMWKDFMRNVINPSCREINTYCDEFHIEVETIKKGREIALITFIITPPKHKLRISRRRDDKINRIENHSPEE